MNLDIISIIISIIALAVSTIQYFSERNRARKEATIHAFDQLEEIVFSQRGYKKLVIRAGAEYTLSSNIKADKEEWNKAMLALSRIEHFAVGVNTGVYDMETLNRMAGSFMIEEFKRWKPIIETKRLESSNLKCYEEFESLYLSLRKSRK